MYKAKSDMSLFRTATPELYIESHAQIVIFPGKM